MNLLTSMSHSPTYQQVVLGKIKSEKAKKKKNRIPVNSETIKYEREKKEMNETFRKKKKKEKSDYRIENTHRSLGQSKETRKTSCLQKHIMAHDIPKELPRTMKSFLKNKN